MIDEILMQVEKPARYIGNEINMVVKDPKDVDIRFAFCFPDSYEVGMSYVGLQILYFFMNRRDDIYCERVFAPWHDMEEKMRENNIELFTLETETSVRKFDFVGFTLQYEMTYTNIINMLNLGNIPIWSKDRTEDDPIIIAGGPCAYNPEPLAEIIDIFYIGEGEVKYDEFFDLYKEIKKQGGTKEDFYLRLLKMEGIYIPKFYELPKEKRNRGLSVTVSSSCFVPKAFTPFQWSAQDTCEEFLKKQHLLKDSNQRKQVKVNYHEPSVSSIEGILARGDRRVSRLIVKAWENGAKFDGWTESFKYDAWLKALEQTGISREFYANRERSYDEVLPWDHISIGVSKRFFIEEKEDIINIDYVDENKIKILISTGSIKNLKPDVLIESFYTFLNIPYIKYKVHYKRVGLFDKNKMELDFCR